MTNNLHFSAPDALRAGPGRAPTEAPLPAAVRTWNDTRERYLERLGTVDGAACFPLPVFRVVPSDDPRAVLTAVEWTEGMPIALPEVDVVLASVSGVFATPIAGRPPRVIPLVMLRPWLDRFPRLGPAHRFGLRGVEHDTGLVHWLLDYDVPPPGLLEALRTQGSERPVTRID